MAKYLTLKQLATIVGVTNYYMKNYIACHYCSLIVKREINYKVKSPRAKNEYTTRKPMHVIEASRLDDFIKWWENRPLGRKSLKTIVEGGINYRWTETARDCYDAKQICENCPNCDACAKVFEIIHRKPIKDYVRKTFSLIGKPPERIYSND